MSTAAARSSTRRVREHRARRRRGGMLVTIEIASDLPDKFCEAGFLGEWDTENPAEIRKAIERVLAQVTGLA